MNNCKKLLAALMSLAMVATIAPVKVDAAPTFCDSSKWGTTATNVNGYVEDLVDALDVELSELTIDAPVTFDEVVEGTIKDVLKIEAEWGNTGKVSLQTVLSAMPAACMSEDAAYLAGYVNGVETLATRAGKIANQLSTDTEYDEDAINAIAELADAKYYYGVLNYWYAELTGTDATKTNPVQLGMWATNLGEEDTPVHAYAVAVIEDLKEILEDNWGAELGSVYAEDLLAEIVAKYPELVKTISTSVNSGEAKIVTVVIEPAELTWIAKTTSKTGSTYKLETLIEKIEADKFVKGYDDNADDDAVVEIMDALYALLETSEVLDELKDTIAEVAGEKIGAANVDEAESLTGAENYTKKTTWGKVFADAKDFNKLLANINVAETESLTTIVEALEEFFTVEIKKTGSRYTVKVEDTDLYLNLPAVLKAAGATGLDATHVLFNQYVNPTTKEKTEYTNYEVLVDYIAGVAADYETVTTGVKGITVNNLTSKNAAKVVAAKEALDNLYDDKAGVVANLTTAEAKAVKAAVTNINLLYAKALLNGIVTDVVTGWVDLGDGNWAYYDENGNGFTGWVAAGSDWYYVKNGAMLRNTWIAKDATGAVWYYVGNNGAMVSNTVVDGYSINANGEWVK